MSAGSGRVRATVPEGGADRADPLALPEDRCGGEVAKGVVGVHVAAETAQRGDPHRGPGAVRTVGDPERDRRAVRQAERVDASRRLRPAGPSSNALRGAGNCAPSPDGPAQARAPEAAPACPGGRSP
ncbi:hypothetical protein GCM10022285_27720 [Streptomyces tunisiensis]|uniref:Uncharacterized protein n=1 Tax=Streptomyces tunisiensis TaxID=948699 RepID=A0ABP7YDS2_9ACTN